MPLIKPKDKLSRPSSYVRLSDNCNEEDDNKDEDGETPKKRVQMIVKKKAAEGSSGLLPRRPSYVKLWSSSSSNENDHEEGTPKGHVPVMVGKEEAGGELKRFVVPTKFMKDPSIVDLLQLSAEEFGYNHQGVVQIPCEPGCFEKIIDKLSKKR